MDDVRIFQPLSHPLMDSAAQVWPRSVPRMGSPSRSPAACRFHAFPPPQPTTRATWCPWAAEGVVGGSPLDAL